MGWFSRACNWVASKCSAVKDKVVETTKEACSKVWNSFTGKKYANEAESILATVEKRYNDAKQEYEDKVRQISERIERKISQINTHKQDVYHTHFNRFINVARRLQNVTVKGQPFEELFDDSILEIQHKSGLRAKSDIMLINFDQMGFLDNLGMVLTLGFFSRSKAKESLERAKQEEARVNEEITKMEAQPRKLAVIEESIDNVVVYFDELIKNYSFLLDRFEYGIQTQRMHQMAINENVFSHKLDFRMLPVVHLEEFQALFNLSIVLKQMSNLGYLSESGEFMESDCKQATVVYKQAQLQKLCA